MKSNSKKIFHYTSLYSLAKILSSKSILFNKLKYVDDQLEASTKDFGHMNEGIFISSWTLYEKENIALWNMYTKNMKGIRVSFEDNPFDIEFKGNIITKPEFKNHIIFSNKTLGKRVEYLPSESIDLQLLEYMDIPMKVAT